MVRFTALLLIRHYRQTRAGTWSVAVETVCLRIYSVKSYLGEVKLCTNTTEVSSE